MTDDLKRARPAGRVIVDGSRIFRYARDGSRVYGEQVWAYEITRLTAQEYTEQPVSTRPLLTPSGKGWNALRMHHVDFHKLADDQWIACVDGLNREIVFGLGY